jgi:bacteriocin-like protein
MIEREDSNELSSNEERSSEHELSDDELAAVVGGLLGIDGTHN